jgi:hypothetical protein
MDRELTPGERKQLAGDFSRQLGGLISPVPVPLLPLRPDLRTQPLTERARIMRESAADWTFTEEETLP